LPKLIAKLEQAQDAETKSELLFAIGGIRSNKTRKFLSSYLHSSDKNIYVTIYVLIALARSGQQVALDKLVECVTKGFGMDNKTVEHSLRMYAAEGLAKLKIKETIPALEAFKKELVNSNDKNDKKYLAALTPLIELISTKEFGNFLWGMEKFPKHARKPKLADRLDGTS
jgi:hypothetical protein